MKKSKLTKVIAIFAIMLYILICGGNSAFAGTLSSDIDAIDESKYPGIKSLIQKLQSNHSNYHFEVYYTGIDWTEAVTMEYQGHSSSPKNLFSAKDGYKGKWYCPICGSTTYDTGWYCASIDAIKYMMDPRNSIDENSVFQFKSLETSDVSAENIQSIINQKYSSYSYINNETAINAIITASTNYGLNGYSILAKIINEQGKGSSPLASGSGYEGQYAGYYNFFNVGAYGNGASTVILNGLKYAKNKGWDSVEKSILGGSEYYKSQYIGRGQNTLYYQRFNVVYNASLFSHQYQQDIMGAETSGRLLKTYYTNSSTIGTVSHNFIIPLYENMPKTACARPSTTENSALEYEEATVTIDKLAVRAAPNSTRIISYLTKNEEIKVLERADKVSSDGYYWDTIVSNTDGTYGYVLRAGISKAVTVVELPKYIFDYKYYADKYSDAKSACGYNEYKLLKHFWETGLAEGRASAATFDVKYYLENNPDLKSAFGTDYEAALNHFKSYGYKEYRRTSETYDPTFYKYYYPDLTALSPEKLIVHYVTYGAFEGRISGLDKATEAAVFDSTIYAECYSDLKQAFGNNSGKLKIHWLQYGISEGRTASIAFDPRMYMELNSDVAKAFGNNYKQAFEQFIKYGIKEGRPTSIMFNVVNYASMNTNLKKDYKQAYLDFATTGISSGKAASNIFDIKTYLNSNPDVKAAYSDNYKLAYIHFINYGIKEPRKTSENFSVVVYKNNYKDLQTAYGNNYKKYYIHYLTYGKSEGRKGI